MSILTHHVHCSAGQDTTSVGFVDDDIWRIFSQHGALPRGRRGEHSNEAFERKGLRRLFQYSQWRINNTFELYTCAVYIRARGTAVPELHFQTNVSRDMTPSFFCVEAVKNGRRLKCNPNPRQESIE